MLTADGMMTERRIEALGHEVIVADSGCAPMCATRSLRVKTDKRNVRALPRLTREERSDERKHRK